MLLRPASGDTEELAGGAAGTPPSIIVMVPRLPSLCCGHRNVPWTTGQEAAGRASCVMEKFLQTAER